MAKTEDFKFSFLVTNEDYIVRDHRVHQVRAVPGVTFVDTVYRYLEMKGFDLSQVELRNFIFMEPVVTTEQFDRQVQVTLTKTKDYWRVLASSQKVKDGVVLSPEWVEHLQGEVHLTADTLQGTLDIEGLKRGAKRVEDTEYSYAALRAAKIDHYEFMKLLGKLYIGENYVLGEMHVGELASEYLDYFYLHPAHLDGATGLPSVFAREKHGSDGSNVTSMIPIYIGAFRTLGRFGDKLYAYVEASNLRAASQDVSYADIEFYDEEGRKFAAYTKFGYKRIRSQELITDLQQVDAEHKDAGVPEPARPTVLAQAVDVSEAIQQQLQGLIAELLGLDIEQIGLEDDFYDLGLDSKNLLQLVQVLEEKIDEKLYPTLLFEYTTIQSLTEYLAEEYSAVFAAPQAQVAAAAEAVTDAVTEPVAEMPVVAWTIVASADMETAIQEDVRQLIATLLGLGADQVGLQDDFYDLGLDSKNLLQLVQQLEEKIGEKLYPTLLFEYTTIQSLTGYLAEDYGNVYPVESVPQTQPVQEQPANIDPATQVLYYRPVWQKAAVEAVHAVKELTGSILVFDTDVQLCQSLRARLGAGSAQVIWIKPGEKFAQTGDAEYEVDPAKATSCNDLIKHLRASGVVIDKVIHAWSKEGFDPQAEALAAQLGNSLHTLFHMCKALVNKKAKGKNNKVQLLYVYQAHDMVQPLYAAMVGFGKTLNLENPKLFVKTIEVTDAGDHAEHMLQEFLTYAADEFGIRYAGEQRFVQRLLNFDLAAVTLEEPVHVKEGGVYLITGGAGGLGLVFAKHLTQQAKVKLVLVGRSELSAEKTAMIQQLEARGSEVMYVRGDLANRDELEAIIVQAKTRFGAIHGVIHSAGVIKDAVLNRKTLEEMQNVLAPKVQGTLRLDEALAAEPLDFFVMFSSSSAVTGNVGQLDYAFANGFMDHFVLYRERLVQGGQRSGKTLSINWPLWKEGGMHVDEQVINLMKEMAGMHPLQTEHGVQAFHDGLRLPHGRLMLIEGDAQRIRAALQSSTTDQDDEDAAEPVIDILGVGDSVPTDSFRDVWTKMQNKEHSAIGNQTVKQEELLDALQNGDQMFHLLVKLDRIRELEVIVAGRGTPVLFINPFGYTAASLTYQFAELTAKHQVINIHQPSVGVSKGYDDLSLSGLSSAYADVLKALNITTPMHVIGLSWGGMIAQTFAKEHADMTASLTLVGTFSNVDFFESGPQLSEKVVEDLEHTGHNSYVDFATSVTYKNLKYMGGYIKHFDLENGRRYSTEAFLEQLEVPTLVLCGAQDLVIPVEQSQLLHAKIPNSQYEEFADAGHLPFITHHDQFNQRLIQFIGEQEANA